jgi:hypothetical protein
LKKDISELFDNNFIWVGDVENWGGTDRVLPYCCFINVDMCLSHNIKYFDGKRIITLNKPKGKKYDTGASFYSDTKELPHKKINYCHYILHLDNGSLLLSNNKRQRDNFVNNNKNLWM